MWAVPVLHPAFTFRQPMQLGPLQAHVSNFVRRGLRGFPDKAKVEINPPVSRLTWLVAECKRRKIALAVDVESAPPDNGPRQWALLPGLAKLRAIGVGADIKGINSQTGERYDGLGLSWYYPCGPAIWSAFQAAMADPDLSKVFCNGLSYDLPILRRYKVRPRGPLHDIRDLRRALSSTSRTGLGPQAAMYLCVSPWKAEAQEDETDEKGFVDASRIKRSKLLTYNAKDCVYTAKIRSKQLLDLKADPADKARIERLYKQHLRTAMVASEMGYKGFPIDEAKRRALSKQLTDLARVRALAVAEALKPHCKVQIITEAMKDKDKKKAAKEAFRISTAGGVNDSDFAALLFHEAAKPHIQGFGLDVPLSDKCRTESGKISVNRDSLLMLMIQDNTPPEAKRLIRLIWQADSPLKARSTYVESEKVLMRIGPEGYVHPSHNSCGTETGRWSCKDPNLYNLSETSEEADLRGELPNIRGMYMAPDGYRIVHRDYKQLELEMNAEYTGDVALRKMLDTGDAHTERVYLFFRIPRDQPVPKALRKLGKIVGFAGQYGAGTETIYVVVLKQDPDALYSDVAEIHRLFVETHVGIVSHWQTSLAFAETHGYNETAIMGRRRYYPPWERLSPTETSNYAIQGTAADVANCALVGKEERDYPRSMHGLLAKHHPKAWIACTTYDSFDVICPEKEAESVNRIMEDTMPGPHRIRNREHAFLSDGKIGKYWSEV